jgi:hypothetical protein
LNGPKKDSSSSKDKKGKDALDDSSIGNGTVMSSWAFDTVKGAGDSSDDGVKIGTVRHVSLRKPQSNSVESTKLVVDPQPLPSDSELAALSSSVALQSIPDAPPGSEPSIESLLAASTTPAAAAVHDIDFQPRAARRTPSPSKDHAVKRGEGKNGTVIGIGKVGSG